MGILPLELGGSILTAPISDCISEKLTQFLNRRSVQSFMDHLKQYELDFEATHDGTIATSGHFLACLQSLYIVDHIVSHVLEPHMDAPTEEQLLAQLGKEMLDYLTEARSQSPSYEDRQTIEVFLSGILKEVKDFLSASRAPEQREPLYVTCQNNAELRDIKKTLGALDTKLSASTPPAEESPSSELPESFDAYIRTCNEALRKARNRVDVYSMNKLDFDAVYILPTLTYVDNAPDFSFPYVDRFIALDRFDAEEKDRFVEQASALAEKGFVKGFLTLSLLMAIYKNEQELPANKVLLYEKCFEYMANTREKGKKLLRNSETNECYDWTVLGHFMQGATFMGLAQLGLPNNADIPKHDVESFLFDQYQNRFFSPVECKAGIEQFLQFCTDRTEVFIPSIRSNDYYRFYHRSFYEYFYAKYIELHTHTVADTYQELCQFGPDSGVFDLLVTLYTRRNPNYLRKLLSYAFSQVEPTIGHQDTASPYPLNTLVLLMQAVGDVDYIRRFITLFLTTKNRISQIRLDVEYTLIQAIFHKDPDYFMDQYRTNMQGLLACVEKELMEFFYRFPDQCDTLLSGIQKSELRLAPLNKQIGFSYIRIFSDLPFGNEQIEQCVINLSDGKYLYGKKRLNHNKATSVLKIVKKTRNLTVAQRARFYQALVAHI